MNKALLYTRRQLGELAGLDEAELSYWTREGILRATEGGGGKGQHRRFPHHEVTLAAVLNQLSAFGIRGTDLSLLAGKFREALDFMTKLGVEHSNLVLFGNLIGSWHEYRTRGYVEEGDTPDVDQVNPHIPREKHPTFGTIRKLSWDQYLQLLKMRDADDEVPGWIIERAAMVEEPEWLRHLGYYEIAMRLPTPPRRYQLREAKVRWLRYFFRDQDGAWAMVPEEGDAAQHISFVGLDIDRLLEKVWGPRL